MPASFFEFQEKLRSPASAAAPAPRQPLTVSELTARITRAITSTLPASLMVKGEASNVRRVESSGHLYFTLKDPDACIDCVMFRSETLRLRFEPADGMELLAEGRVGVYGQRGRYQFYVSTLRPLGKGALEVAFQQVRAKLAAEGLFAPERKKLLPNYPLRIAIVSSADAAALQDILKVLRRFAWLKTRLYPAPVQGEGAAEQIVAAIRQINRATDPQRRAQVILLARGGGSLEDLWPFNQEIVARAIAGSEISVITGIGHEVDVTIADLAADYHAHTPTEAAQVLTSRWRGAAEQLGQCAARLHRAIRSLWSDGSQRLAGITRHETFRRPKDRVNSLRQLLDDRQRSLAIAQDRLLQRLQQRIRDATLVIERYGTLVFGRHRDVIDGRRQRLEQAMSRRLRAMTQELDRAQAAYRDRHPRHRIALLRLKVQTIREAITRAAAGAVAKQQHRLDSLSRELEALSPNAVLARGYTLTLRKKDGTPVRSAAAAKPGERILTRFADGQIESTVEDSKQPSLFE